jgi:hypothetical protein
MQLLIGEPFKKDYGFLACSNQIAFFSISTYSSIDIKKPIIAINPI